MLKKILLVLSVLIILVVAIKLRTPMQIPTENTTSQKTQTQNELGFLLVEAEDATKIEKPFILKTATFGNEKATFLEIPQGDIPSEEKGNIKGAATYSITVPHDGEYTLWVRRRWLDGCGNSIWFVFPDMPPCIVGEDGTYIKDKAGWHWSRYGKGGGIVKLKKGTITLSVKPREDGIWLDKFLLVEAPWDEYQPSFHDPDLP